MLTAVQFRIVYFFFCVQSKIVDIAVYKTLALFTGAAVTFTKREHRLKMCEDKLLRITDPNRQVTEEDKETCAH
jgi:hypothetical protein